MRHISINDQWTRRYARHDALLVRVGNLLAVHATGKNENKRGDTHKEKATSNIGVQLNIGV